MKFIAAAAVLILCGGLILSSTYTWQTSEDYKLNEFNIAGVRGKIEEVFEPPAEGISPGDSVYKRVDVLNDSGTPVFVRVMALPVISQGDENPELLLSTDILSLNINTGAWLDGGDGYYYYRGLLPSGESTHEPLFTNVRLSENLPPEYENARLEIYIVSEVCGVNLTYGYRKSYWGGAGEGSLQAVDAMFTELTDEYYK